MNNDKQCVSYTPLVYIIEQIEIEYVVVFIEGGYNIAGG